jgi:hypothetical protein
MVTKNMKEGHMTIVNRNILIAGVLIAALALAGVGLWLVSRRSNEQAGSSNTSTSQQGSSSSSSSSGSTSDEPTTYDVKVYFSKHPESDNDPGATFAVARTSQDLGLGSFAITELLKGPTASESDKGYFTTVRLRSGDSTCNGKDFTLRIAKGLAQLQFCKPFDHLGVVADGQAESEINATLKQFDTVTKVRILNSSGNCEFDLSGQNKCLQ